MAAMRPSASTTGCECAPPASLAETRCTAPEATAIEKTGVPPPSSAVAMRRRPSALHAATLGQRCHFSAMRRALPVAVSKIVTIGAGARLALRLARVVAINFPFGEKTGVA